MKFRKFGGCLKIEYLQKFLWLIIIFPIKIAILGLSIDKARGLKQILRSAPNGPAQEKCVGCLVVFSCRGVLPQTPKILRVFSKNDPKRGISHHLTLTFWIYMDYLGITWYFKTLEILLQALNLLCRPPTPAPSAAPTSGLGCSSRGKNDMSSVKVEPV